MNTNSLTIETLGGTSAESASDEGWVIYSTLRQSIVSREQSARPMTPTTHRKPPLRSDSTRRVLRRLKGFLVEDRGLECKVAFIENNNPIFYYLPSKGLRSAGINAENQPFEMDEFESKNADGSFSTGYTFRPLATSADAFSDPLTWMKGADKSVT